MVREEIYSAVTKSTVWIWWKFSYFSAKQKAPSFICPRSLNFNAAYTPSPARWNTDLNAPSAFSPRLTNPHRNSQIGFKVRVLFRTYIMLTLPEKLNQVRKIITIKIIALLVNKKNRKRIRYWIFDIFCLYITLPASNRFTRSVN